MRALKRILFPIKCMRRITLTPAQRTTLVNIQEDMVAAGMNPAHLEYKYKTGRNLMDDVFTSTVLQIVIGLILFFSMAYIGWISFFK